VLAVGYGQEKDASGTEQPVWYVKNSWSTTCKQLKTSNKRKHFSISHFLNFNNRG